MLQAAPLEASAGRRVVFIHMQRGVSTVPCLMSTLVLLARSGYQIELFTLEGDADAERALTPEGVSVHPVRGGYGKNYLVLLLSVGTMLWTAGRDTLKKRQSVEAILGIHLTGLVVGTILSALLRIPHIYYQLELYFLSEIRKPSWRLCRRVERWCCRRSVLTVTQDWWRARLCSRENGVPLSRLTALPNSMPGTGSRLKTSYLRDKLGIPDGRKIILTMGTRFFDSEHRDELAASIAKWPSEWVLVVHSISVSAEDISRLPAPLRAPGRIYFSNRPVLYDQLSELHASADLALVLYQNDDRPAGGRNQTYIGLSSGQFNLYVRYGIPTITTRQPTFEWLFRKYRCGVALDDFSSMERAVEKILADHESYQQAALDLYDDLLRFERYFPDFEMKLRAYCRAWKRGESEAACIPAGERKRVIT
jgi:hypothetical protein